MQRFCQRCGRCHELSAFDGDRRSCREQLARHNARYITVFVSALQSNFIRLLHAVKHNVHTCPLVMFVHSPSCQCTVVDDQYWLSSPCMLCTRRRRRAEQSDVDRQPSPDPSICQASAYPFVAAHPGIHPQLSGQGQPATQYAAASVPDQADLIAVGVPMWPQQEPLQHSATLPFPSTEARGVASGSRPAQAEASCQVCCRSFCRLLQACCQLA